MLNLEKFLRKTKLIIFEVNGVIAKRNDSKLTPEARQLFSYMAGIASMGQEIPYFAMISNEGNVAYRTMLIDNGKHDEAAKLPTMLDVRKRHYEIAKQIPVYVFSAISFAYKNYRHEWARVPISQVNSPEWKRSWRMPQPGMINATLAHFGIEDRKSVMVVCSTDKAQTAAARSGCEVIGASMFLDSGRNSILVQLQELMESVNM